MTVRQHPCMADVFPDLTADIVRLLRAADPDEVG
jgi:hypothetical protein